MDISPSRSTSSEAENWNPLRRPSPGSYSGATSYPPSPRLTSRSTYAGVCRNARSDQECAGMRPRIFRRRPPFSYVRVSVCCRRRSSRRRRALECARMRPRVGYNLDTNSDREKFSTGQVAEKNGGLRRETPARLCPAGGDGSCTSRGGGSGARCYPCSAGRWCVPRRRRMDFHSRVQC